MDVFLVFPHQLFVKERQNTVFFFLEDAHFFNDGIAYHQHKIVLHRASMKAHFDTLDCEKYYLAYPFELNTIKEKFKSFEHIYAYDPINHELKKRYAQFNVVWLDSPNFITDELTFRAYFKDKKNYFMKDFYVFQRKRLNLLIDKGKPIGGKYSFDTENRKKLPKHIEIPEPIIFDHNDYVLEAIRWTETHFKNNPGNIESFNHPTTRKEALLQMEDFFLNKFSNFGPYEDALSNQDVYLFHANISSSLNIGLLSPQEIVDKAMAQDVPIESKEGFIRQIIGWREFIRAMYVLEGEKMKVSNYLNHQNRLSNAWYEGNTGIPVLDQTISKLNNNAYAHHIERLMIIGNIMMLLNIHPDEVYLYFMTMFIDAYEWVMIPNIYGMSQFAAGDLMTTKPYFSGSNYLLKMGAESGSWTKTIDALFYLFIKDHRKIIESNPRLGILIMLLDKQSDEMIKSFEELKHGLISRSIL